ncbi:polysaccharide biosynthesis protein GumN [Sphingopyxis sp. Root214]|uniref:TraB/GumN family protein n=1 Tax=unclassified Sphingopyxis TaxID=2614943 RepID=UPI0006FACEE6|nr:MULTISPECIES: TraB/GumN family protein [unclassified Sphingopyxis]KQZ76450.1 polysaccharide biosynthesis protein GumN [Sphingopyxis sp. Root154]KRC09663.1 polysaccharide biosynthesis protein GumN [Sphingopyxis sp. Root214]
MKTWFKKLATTCAIVAFSSSALPAAYAAEPGAAAAPATTDADPALWVVKDKDTTIYLFGTVHVLKPGLGWFDEAVKTAFDKSDELMLEMVMPEDQVAMLKEMMSLAMDQSGKTLSSRLDPEQLKAYEAALASLGIAPTQFDMFEPWFPAMTLSVLPLTKLGYDPEQGVEKLLTSSAKRAGKPVVGLETLGQQLGYFDTLPENQQISFLNSVVRDLDKLGPQLDKMVGQWAKGDPDALAVTMNESLAETPELGKVLLWDRNARWADQLKARMDQPGTVFVAVGAGHLAGDKSVQDYLKARGIVAKRVKY